MQSNSVWHRKARVVASHQRKIEVQAYINKIYTWFIRTYLPGKFEENEKKNISENYFRLEVRDWNWRRKDRTYVCCDGPKQTYLVYFDLFYLLQQYLYITYICVYMYVDINIPGTTLS